MVRLVSVSIILMVAGLSGTIIVAASTYGSAQPWDTSSGVPNITIDRLYRSAIDDIAGYDVAVVRVTLGRVNERLCCRNDLTAELPPTPDGLIPQLQ